MWRTLHLCPKYHTQLLGASRRNTQNTKLPEL
jgi:hypothetical protein